MVVPHRIALVACAKTKAAHPAPACELYQSPLFRLQLAAALRHATTEHDVFIRRAKHGLLELDAVIAPYDVNLSDLSKPRRAAWGQTAVEALARRYSFEAHLPAPELAIFAGADYAAPFVAGMVGWKVQLPLAGLQVGQRLSLLTRQERDVRAGAL